jgi:Subtilase family
LIPRRARAALVVALAALCGCSAHQGRERRTPEPKSKARQTGSPGVLHPGALQRLQEASRRQVMVTLRAPVQEPVSVTLMKMETIYRLQTVAVWDMKALEVPCIVFSSRADKPLSFLVRQLEKDPRIALAQPVQWFETLAEEAEPPRQGSPREDPYRSLQYGADALRLSEAHHLATGRGVTVAVVDTGVDLEHPDLEGRVVVARDFVSAQRYRPGPNLHGTGVAGIIAASAGNGLGIVGVAPEAKILALKACWPIGKKEEKAACNSYTLALALDFAVSQGAQVINLSLAGPEDPILGALIETAHARGAVVVAAAGGPALPFPASMTSVLAVVSAPAEGAVHRAPETLPARTLTAPGEEVLTTVPRAAYDFLSGSSFAAAHVSGVVALLLQHRPKLRPEQVREILKESPTLDAFAAVRLSLEPLPQARAASG